MSDVDGKPKVTNFKKRPHRPWKTSLLESTVQESQGLETSDPDLIDFTLDADAADFVFNIDTSPLPELSPSLHDTFSQLEAIALKDEPKAELQTAIKNTAQTKSALLQKITDKSSSSILLGGFFQPQQLNSSEETQSARKMNFLLSDLKNKEQELTSLTNNLRVTEAIEKAEQAELNRRAEEQRRIAAEHRMRQAIEQTQSAANQCRLAMEQANQAAVAHREEEQYRQMAETQVADFKVRVNTTDLALQHERNAKMAAEQAAQHALQQTEQAMQRTTELANENAQLLQKIATLETSCNETNASLIYNQQKLQELTAQRDKLKSIIEAEQELRRVAERRAQEAIQRAEEAEKARDLEEQQRIMIDARAKKAVEHASRTVMHLLNAPVDNEYNMRVPQESSAKIKIKVPAETAKQVEYIPNDDDYSF